MPASNKRKLKAGSFSLGCGEPLFILGPCVIESERMIHRAARRVIAIAREAGVGNLVFKASYDKANRTSVKSYRGIGVREGCEILAGIGQEFGVPVTTDIHTAEEAEIASPFIDILQIPAFLCRQTDLLKAASHAGRIVNVKKGQFLAPWDIANVAAKLDRFNAAGYFFTERGTTFGYNNLIADMRSLYWIREAGYPVVFDATHSVQRPGGGGDQTSGDAVLAPVLARAAMAAGCDGIFIETHENPAKALSDGPNMIPFRALGALLKSLLKIHAAAG